MTEQKARKIVDNRLKFTRHSSRGMMRIWQNMPEKTNWSQVTSKM